MLIQKIKSWLWNQMFQYAFVKALSLRNKIDFRLDISSYKAWPRNFELEIFNIGKKYVSNKEIPRYERYIPRINYLNYINEAYLTPFCWKLNKSHHIERDIFECDNKSVVDDKFLSYTDWYIEWYFQSEKYFLDFKDDIKKEFRVNWKLSEKSRCIIDKMEKLNSVSIHIRRWDYLNKSLINTFWILSKEYYKDWIEVIKNKTKKPLYIFFFSDDIQWVKDNFKYDNSYFIDWNAWKDSRQDMILMSKCKHSIIANSSFSWWWARLNENKNKIVIAPNRWFKSINPLDIIPSDWNKIDNTFIS